MMNVFQKCSIAAIASVASLIAGISPAQATPEAPMDGSFTLEDYAQQEDLDFAPPSFDYEPIPQVAPLTRATTWQTVGENAVVAGDYPNALAAFNKAVQLAPEVRPEMLEQRGWLHYSLGNEEDALEDISKAAELHLEERDFSAHSNALEMREFVDVQFDS